MRDRRLWLWLGVAATVLLVMLLGSLLTRGPGDRSKVSAYVEAANASQRELASGLRRANLVYGEFALDPATLAARRGELEQAERTIRRVRTRFAVVPAPEAAATLRRLLLRTIDLEAALAHELVEVAVALPRLAELNEAVPKASKRLARELKGAATSDEQQAALRRYAKALRKVVTKVEALDPPPLLAPSFAVEAARLRNSATVMSRLARAVAEGNAAEIDQLNRYLREVAEITGATKSERAAVVLYERRLRAIATARTAVENELQRLDGELS